MNIQLRKFDPATIDDNRVCVFIGKRNTGKSTLITDVLYHKRHIPVGVVMSGTEEGNSYYQQYVPDLFVYSEFKQDVVEKIIARQKKVIKSKNIQDKSVFLLLDDCMYDKKLLRDKLMRCIFYNGRHWKICLMLAMQYCMDLSPDLRCNIDYIFILRENILQNREKLWKNFFGIFPTFDMFNQVMTACTENYECLVLDNTSKSNKIEDVVFWYKAKIHKEFKTGHPKFWQMHRENYDPNHEDDEKNENLLKDKKKPILKIKKKGKST